MKTYKILNLYACLGGNRAKWDEAAKQAGIEIEVTAVELDRELARMYQERFPNDMVIIADAHQYLLDHFKEFDFIWSSPPCPSHSKINISQYTRENWKPHYPDMKLYEEVIFFR
jgi:DNA (cytosine-5)-methyltransferase 1